MKNCSAALASIAWVAFASAAAALPPAATAPQLSEVEKLVVSTLRNFETCVAEAEADRAVRFKPYFEALSRYHEEYDTADAAIRRQAPVTAKARVAIAADALREAARLMGKTPQETLEFLDDVKRLEEFRFRESASRPKAPTLPPGYHDHPRVLCHDVLAKAGLTHNDLLRELGHLREKLGPEEYQRLLLAP